MHWELRMRSKSRLSVDAVQINEVGGVGNGDTACKVKLAAFPVCNPPILFRVFCPGPGSSLFLYVAEEGSCGRAGENRTKLLGLNGSIFQDFPGRSQPGISLLSGLRTACCRPTRPSTVLLPSVPEKPILNPPCRECQRNLGIGVPVLYGETPDGKLPGRFDHIGLDEGSAGNLHFPVESGFYPFFPGEGGRKQVHARTGFIQLGRPASEAAILFLRGQAGPSFAGRPRPVARGSP